MSAGRRSPLCPAALPPATSWTGGDLGAPGQSLLPSPPRAPGRPPGRPPAPQRCLARAPSPPGPLGSASWPYFSCSFHPSHSPYRVTPFFNFSSLPLSLSRGGRNFPASFAAFPSSPGLPLSPSSPSPPFPCPHASPRLFPPVAVCLSRCPDDHRGV